MMSIQDALITCYKKSFTIKGRASRSEYWWFQLHMPAFLFFSITIDPNGYFMVGIFFLLLFISLPANFCVIVRRWHDLGRSGWHILILLIPWIGWIVTFMYFCMNSSEEGNYYNSLSHLPKKKSTSGTSVFDDNVSKLKSIADLRSSGILNEREFETEKAKILSEPSMELQNPPPRDPRPIVAHVQQTDYNKPIDLQENINIENHQVEEPKDMKKKGLLNELKKMLSEGLIDNDEFKQMKKEILGK